MSAELQIRIHGAASLPALVYLPGLHGDWTLVSSFRAAVAGCVRFVEFTYPRTVTWSLEDHAVAIESALLAHGIDRGWLLAESFGSQPAWQLIDRSLPSRSQGQSAPTPNPQSAIRNPQFSAGSHRSFQPEGLILAGGFVRHPVIPGVRVMRHLNAALPPWALRRLFRLYAGYARFRHRHAAETFDCLGEFVANRLAAGDQAAIVHRLDLIAGHDPSPIAGQIRLPVHYLAGLIDPLVPWPFVRRWLRRNCPGYRGGATILSADHNVLGTAPQVAARLVLGWMSGGPAS
jgi:pimeloyl-ACP methyl ester carboxylesterase